MSELLRAFRFQVQLLRSPDIELGSNLMPDTSKSGTRLGDGLFQECSGLELETDVREYLEGGRNDGVIRRVGRVKLSPLVLKRGMFVGDDGLLNRALWSWMYSIISGDRPVVRYDGIIEVLHPRGSPVQARWTFDRGLPAKVVGPTLNGATGEIAVEELTIHHEGLRMVVVR
jgi:phage tail-like protein